MKTLINHSTSKEGIHMLTLDMPGSSANVFNEETFEALNREIDSIENNPDISALIISSAKPSVFIAGADLKTFFKKDISDSEIDHFIRMGQNTFNRISELPFPSISAIHGACLGGGLELALACDYRVASNDKSTKIGLPEVLLGILPAWGGSTRLPRLIGMTNAVNVILSGRQYTAAKARKLGIIDKVVFKEQLLDAAKSYAHKTKRKTKPFHACNIGPIRWFIKGAAKKATLSKTLGNYPAPIMALDVMFRGLSQDIPSSLEAEREAVTDLLHTEVSRNLIRTFFLQERSKKMKASDTPIHKGDSLKDIAVIGAGVMGSGIAQWLSSRGHKVLLKDISREQLSKGLKTAKGLFNQAVKRRIITREEATSGMDRITPRAHAVPMHTTDLVIEAAVEKMDIKKAVLKDLESSCREDAVIATNTSALSITEIASGLKRPQNFIGIHFFNPVHRMKLVEVVCGEQTSLDTVERTLQFVKKIGKLPVIVQDGPGFLVNRILVPYLMEAVRLYELGNEVDKVDAVMKRFGMPMGPLRLIDEVGLDVAQHVGIDLAQRLPHLTIRSYLLEDMLGRKWLGRKSGRGFYHYENKKRKSKVNYTLAAMRRKLESDCPSLDEIQERLVLLMVNEGARCLEEGIVKEPHDVDFGMIMGTGWAPFRGGPLRYADHMGLSHVVDRLKLYANEGRPMYEPANILLEKARSGKTFYENA